MSGRRTRSDDASVLLEKAQTAINRGDVREMLDALAASGYLDGLKRRLQKKWGGSIPASAVDECVAQAVDAACEGSYRKREIRNLGAWLWKVATNIADEVWRSDYAQRVDFDEAMVHTSVEGEERRREEETRRKEAVRIARELLPRIGSGQVVDVMELVIAAAEDGLPDLPASSISEALGISEDASRALVSRGLRRFRRVAGQEGVEIPASLPETD